MTALLGALAIILVVSVVQWLAQEDDDAPSPPRPSLPPAADPCACALARWRDAERRGDTDAADAAYADYLRLR